MGRKNKKNASASSSTSHNNTDQEQDQIDTVLRLGPRTHCRTDYRVKVFIDGNWYGRCVNLAAYNGYEDLVSMVRDMFHRVTYQLLWPNVDMRSEDGYVLTYYDKDDNSWMMCGDVPYEMFLEVVKHLRICRRVDAYNCRNF